MTGEAIVVRLSRAAAAAGPFALALAIGAVILAATGYEPISVYRLMIVEAFGGERRIAATLTAATPLLLTGLAAAIAFRAGIFNVGAEGCFYLGGIVAAVVGYAFRTGLARCLFRSLSRQLHCRRGLADLPWAPARPPRRRRGRDDADAELHRHRPDELARQWPVAGAWLGQLRDAADCRGRRIAASRTGRDPSSRLPPQLVPRHRLRLLEPVHRRRLSFPPGRTQSPFQPRGRHRSPGRFHGRDGRFGRHRRSRGRHPYARPRASFRRGLFAGLWLHRASRSRCSPAIRRSAWRSPPSFSARSSSAGANIQLFSNVPIEIVEILQGAVMIFAVAQFGVGWISRWSAS